MNKTNIEWVKNPDGTQGYTWNPITGCLNNCPYCFARKLANGRLKEKYIRPTYAYNSAPPYSGYPGIEVWPNVGAFYPRFWPGKLREPAKIGRPAGIFTCDMGDLFGKGVPHEWTEKVLAVAKRYPWHRFYLLTKQPQNLKKFSPFSDNCWVGVSATDHDMAYNAYVYLRAIEAKVKYISFEPLLDAIGPFVLDYLACTAQWFVVGAQTNPSKLPDKAWVNEIIECADFNSIKVFLKNSLQPLFPGQALRQEMPQ